MLSLFLDDRVLVEVGLDWIGLLGGSASCSSSLGLSCLRGYGMGLAWLIDDLVGMDTL